MSLVKVVRDKYDERTKEGTGWKLQVVAPADRGPALRAKLSEEVSEYLEDRTVEELVDTIEAVVALARTEHGVGPGTLMVQVARKRAEKGGFGRVLGLYLEPPENVR